MPREARQRWRLTISRDERTADLDERRFVEALVEGFVAAGLPVAMTGGERPRARVGLALPLPRGATAEADLVELYLAERLPAETVRRGVSAGLPAGVLLVVLEDEWIGAPSLASRVGAVVYRAEVRTDAAGPAPEATESGRVRILEWDDAAGKGALVVRFERDEAGRLGRPAEAIAAVDPRLRINRLVRVSVELAGE